jgi:molybdate transport system substrate-binding protein
VNRYVMTLVALALCSGACAASPGEELLVSAAASLTDAFGEVEVAFEAAHPGVEVLLNMAGSSTLRQQIVEGAPVDVFASADSSNMDQVAAAGEVDGAPRAFAANRLQITVPAGNPAGVTGLEDFADEDLLIGLCATGVPCGDLALTVLENAGVTPAIDTREPDVRALLTKIQSGELDAGLTYVTDVVASGGAVHGIDIPDGANATTNYQIASLVDSSDPSTAAAFVAFVLSPEGQAILNSYGFTSP